MAAALLTRTSRNPYCFYFVALVDGRIVGGAGYTELCGEANIDNVVVVAVWPTCNHYTKNIHKCVW